MQACWNKTIELWQMQNGHLNTTLTDDDSESDDGIVEVMDGSPIKIMKQLKSPGFCLRFV